MADPPVRASTLYPGAELTAARQHYADGIGWLNRQDVSTSTEGRVRCAVMAAAHFSAGQLALAIGAAEKPTAEEGNPHA